MAHICMLNARKPLHSRPRDGRDVGHGTDHITMDHRGYSPVDHLNTDALNAIESYITPAHTVLISGLVLSRSKSLVLNQNFPQRLYCLLTPV